MAEFLLQAIGELDAGGIAVLAVASVTVFVVRQLLGTVATVATEWLRRLLNPSRKADASGSGLARPQPLGSHRQPGNRPARPFQGSTPEKLARSMRCSGRVPISHYRHQRWLVAFWRAVKLYLSPREDPAEVGVHCCRLAIRAVGSDGTRGGPPLLRRIRAACAASPTREPIPPATVSAGGRFAGQEPAPGRHRVGAGPLRARVVGAVPRCGRRHSLPAEAEPRVGRRAGR